ncbi:major capsid protein [Vespertilionid gammaherpesvirus 1]|uniref:Major capsid protein n=1 Tax=Vespertilionid gammaherpesvirus 1 TaxID=2560830 RepID=A0A0X9XSK5_9GAMA|nr:major capsid protein [Myotis gammaherpesvirus 8]AMA67382.1 major capsid protein [Vespertilionid gammaherpesvirus 1]
MEAAVIENRPYPYFVTEANLLKQVKESAAEGLFKSFQLLLGKDVRENGVKFEVLLGVYTSAVQFVKFLETSLAVSCVNTEFKDLKRMTNGKIQFKISVPTIAHGDGRRPTKQRQYLVMKACNKHHISTEIELAVLDLEILHASQETPLDLTEYIGAVKTLTSALQFGIDALERGLVDTVLNVKIRCAPPLFIYKTLSDPTYVERGLKKTVKSDLVAMFKSHLLENSFFLDKAAFMNKGTQYVMSMLSDIIGSVCEETVFKGVSTYTTQSGETVDGVIETTDNVMRKILTLLGTSGNSVIGPAAYANYVVRGDNLVTALSYGKAMKTFDQFVARIIDNPNRTATTENDLSAISDGQDNLPRTAIQSSIVRIGDKNVAIESLQKMYNEAQIPFPLNRRMQYSFYFPVGLHMSDPKYSSSNVVKGAENPFYQPTEAWIVNKNNTLLCFSYQTALKSTCHPRVHNPVLCAHVLQNAFPELPENRNNYGKEFQAPVHMNLYAQLYDYYNNKNDAFETDLAKKATITTDDILHPGNNNILKLEVHPLFDFYVMEQPGAKVAYRATHRNMVGNIPAPFAPLSFQDSRGYQFETATHINHVIDSATMEIVQESAFDPNYPVICYVVEALIHGQEDKFILNSALIALIIETYWTNTGRLAFVNSFHMIKFICLHLGGSTISKEVYSLYRKIYGELVALEQALIKMAGHDNINRRHVGQFVNSLLDHNLLPPFVYNNVFKNLFQHSDRKPELVIGMNKIKNEGDLDNGLRLVDVMENNIHEFANLYNNRVDEDHAYRYQLDVGIHEEHESSIVLQKIFYYVFLPVCTNGHVCGMGVDYNNVALTVTYNGPVFADIIDGDENIMHHLENGTLKNILEASDIAPTVDMIRTLSTSFLTCPINTQTARVNTNRDPAQAAITHERGRKVSQTVLVNGFAAFAVSERNRVICECMFFPVPFNKMYCDPMVAATIQPLVADYINQIPSQRDSIVFNVPPTFMAEYEEWHKSPMAHYVKNCTHTPLSLSAMVSMHNKLSPVAFINQAKNKIHPGVALTVVRTDEVLSENILYSSRASTSVFVGQPTVTRKEVRSDAVTFEINHELASLNTSLGYSSILTPAHAAAITTDMGIHCQNLFSMYPSEHFGNRDVQNYIKNKIGITGTATNAADPRNYAGGGYLPNTPPGLCHGQLASCEVILTPVTADVSYFQSSNSPRGRGSCVVSCNAYSNESAEKFLYDHSLPDPVYEYRNTINPWASQIGSLGDVMYNGSYRQMTAPGIYSPCRQFFTKDELLKNNKGLFSLVNEYSSRLTGTPATSGTDIQYVVINGTDVFLEQPCLFLQEAFPTLSASHKVLLDEYMSYKNTHTPVHHSQFIIEEVAPLKRIFKAGNKLVY